MSELTYIDFCFNHVTNVYPYWMMDYFAQCSVKERLDYYHQYSKVLNQINHETLLQERLYWMLKDRPKNLPLNIEYDIYVSYCMFESDFDFDGIFLKDGIKEKWDSRYQEQFNQLIDDLYIFKNDVPETFRNLIEEDELPF